MLSLLLAQATTTTTFDTSAADAAATAAATDSAAAGGLLAFILVYMAWIVVIAIASFAFWLWALIDIIRRQFSNPSDKNLWLILVIVGAFIGGPIIPIIYLIVGRKKGTMPAPTK